MNNMRTGIWLVFVLILSSSCSSNSLPIENTIQATPEIVTISFAAQDGERGLYEPLIQEFNEQNPNIRVQFVSLTKILQSGREQKQDQDSKMREWMSSADTSVSLFIDESTLQSGYLHDLKPFMDADPSFNADDFYPGALEIMSDNGKVFLVPHTIRIPLLEYNKDLWDKEGLPFPSTNWTLKDMLGAAEQIGNSSRGNVSTYGYVSLYAAREALLSELSTANIRFSLTRPEQFRLSNTEAIMALENVANLVSSKALYHQENSSDIVSIDPLQSIILEQRAGMWPSGTLYKGGSNPVPTFKVGVAVFPSDFLSPTYRVQTIGYVMSSGTQHPKEAWKWLSFLSQKASPTLNEGEENYVPARRSIAEELGFWSNLAPAVKDVLEASIYRHSTALSIKHLNMYIMPLLDGAINKVAFEGVSAQAVFTEIDNNLTPWLLKLKDLEQQSASSDASIIVNTPIIERQVDGAIPITFGVAPYRASLFEQVARRFNETQTEVFVTVKTVVDATDATASTDCFAWQDELTQDQLASLMDIQPFIDTDKRFSQSLYPKALFTPLTLNGTIRGLPYGLKLRMLGYDKDAFIEAGIEPPNVKWTLNDFRGAAQRLTSTSLAGPNKRYGFASTSPEDIFFVLDRYNAPITLQDGKSIQLNYTDPLSLIHI